MYECFKRDLTKEFKKELSEEAKERQKERGKRLIEMRMKKVRVLGSVREQQRRKIVRKEKMNKRKKKRKKKRRAQMKKPEGLSDYFIIKAESQFSSFISSIEIVLQSLKLELILSSQRLI